jgi:MFS family permease
VSALQGTAFDALRVPSFALLWTAQLLSKFGDPITLIALAAVTYQLTGSALATALAVLVTVVPSALFGFFAGAVADALGHRRAMIATDLVRAGLIGAIPLLLDAGAPLALAYGLVFIAGICAAVFNPARIAIVPALVPATRLTAGNSLVLASDRTVEIGGAVVGGLLVAAIGQNAFYVDALTFALSAALLARMRVVEGPLRGLALERIWRETATGLNFIARSTVLRANTIYSLAAQLSIPVLNGLLPVLIFRGFAGGDARLGSALFGTAEAAIAAGAVMGGIALPGYLARFPKGRLGAIGFALYGGVVILVALAPTYAALLLLLVATGVTNVVFFVPNLTIFQEWTPAELRGRVFGARMALVSLSWLPIVLAVGLLAERFDARILIGAAGALTLGAALVGLRLRAISDVR